MSDSAVHHRRIFLKQIAAVAGAAPLSLGATAGMAATAPANGAAEAVDSARIRRRAPTRPPTRAIRRQRARDPGVCGLPRERQHRRRADPAAARATRRIYQRATSGVSRRRTAERCRSSDARAGEADVGRGHPGARRLLRWKVGHWTAIRTPKGRIKPPTDPETDIRYGRSDIRRTTA